MYIQTVHPDTQCARGDTVGLSNAIASDMMLGAMIKVFIVFTGGSIERASELLRGTRDLGARTTYDLCSIAGISVPNTSGGSVVYVNISNNGSTEWWDYGGSYAIVEIRTVDGAKLLYSSSVDSLNRTIYGDLINPSITDPGKILSIEYMISSIYIPSISSLRVFFSTQGGGVCAGGI